MAHDVFISYSTKDKHAADAVCAVLERNGIRCWIAPRDVLPGMAWGSAIVSAIHEAKLIVLVFSGNANTSPQIEREVERAISHGLAVIPFRIEDIKPSHSLEYFISASHWLDAFTEPMEQHLETLARVVHHILELKQGRKDEAGAVVAAPSQAQPCPLAPPPLPAVAPAAPGAKQWMLVGAGTVLGAALVLAVLLYVMQSRKAPVQTAVVTAPAPQPAAVPPEPATPAQPASVQPPAAQPSGPSLAGRWKWDAVCAGTGWHGKFDVADTAQGHFNGNFDGTEWYDVGTITDGAFDGTSVSFTRASGTYIQFWKGRLAGSKIEGSVTGNTGNCTFMATRD
jgi:hypothetical protein